MLGMAAKSKFSIRSSKYLNIRAMLIYLFEIISSKLLTTFIFNSTGGILCANEFYHPRHRISLFSSSGGAVLLRYRYTNQLYDQCYFVADVRVAFIVKFNVYL